MTLERMAGAVVPLFSIRTRRDWGIGQITDLPVCAQWLRRAGQRLLQILPPHQLSAGETSPYGALTAFGIDPIYVDVEATGDLDAAGVEATLGELGMAERAALRSAERADYTRVRALKARALHAAFQAFHEHEWVRATRRARSLAAFVQGERAWLDDLSLYEVLRERHEGWGWTTWPEEERDRSPATLATLRSERALRLLEVSYGQWVALSQWDEARKLMRAAGVELMGDLPFVVCAESADVWAHASQFQSRLSLGAPPDAYSEDGQDWGLPPYDWLSMESDGLAWVRARAQHASRLYDRFRLDHVVGYFRQWVKGGAPGSRGRFDPEGSDAQDARGRRVLGAILQEVGRSDGVAPPRALAEDLGVIPPFVRHALAELRMPGYRVLPWERDGETFRDPRAFPAESIASWSTHDTAPIVSWWHELSPDDRRRLADRAGTRDDAPEPERTVALLGDLYRSGSSLALTLAPELLGLPERINTPATVGVHNWSWRLPRPIEDLEGDSGLSTRFAAIHEQVDASGRGPSR